MAQFCLGSGRNETTLKIQQDNHQVSFCIKPIRRKLCLNVFDELQSGAVYGETVDEAITIAKEAIELYIERLVVHNGPVPDE